VRTHGTSHYRACLLSAAVLLAGCGGGAQGTCTLGNAAGCGGSLQPAPPVVEPPPPDPAVKAASISLVFSSNELPSAGQPGSDVTVTALVKTADNTAVADAKVVFSADSGFLAVAGASTDKSGKVSATLGTGGSRLNRPITVTAKAGAQSASAVVNVVGTTLSLSGPAFLSTGSAADMMVTLLDSAGRPIAGEAVSASTRNGNALLVGAKLSDRNGQVPLHLDASRRGAEQVTVTALGASAVRDIMVGGSDVSVAPAILVDAGGAELLQEVAVGSCAPVDGRYAVGGAGQNGAVTLAASRGTLYADPGCSQPLGGALALVNGDFPRSYIRSDNAGVSTIDASVAGGPSGSTRLEFVASLLPSSKVKLQSDISVVASGEHSELVAVVRDGTAANNLVKGVTVQFAILADSSGGTLVAPFTGVTGSDGVARATFVAGPADGGKDGTVIQARIAALPNASATTTLTVNKKALSIQFGTGNTLVAFSSAVLQQDFAVFVSDSAGNPVKDLTISAAAWPTLFAKGQLEWVADTATSRMPGVYRPEKNVGVCPNEDIQRKGLYDAAFDRNGNGMLEPGIPLSVSLSGKTDAQGLATVSLRYPRDRAYWVKVELTVTGNVAGTESVARNAFWLTGIASDYTTYAVAPPGAVSPYGVDKNCTNAN